MRGTIKAFFDSSSFLPHGHCYIWLKSLVALHIASDAIITLSYYSIPITLVYFVKQKPDLPYRWMFLMFGAFIVACGTTHLMEVITVYVPIYWVSGSIKAVTALLSVITAITLVPLVPKALALRAPADLEATNQRLRLEIEERKRAELLGAKTAADLAATHKELETFSYSISHDLRAPLRVIDGFSRILLATQSDRLDAEGVEYLRRVRSSTKRMGVLIDDLLALSRLPRPARHEERL